MRIHEKVAAMTDMSHPKCSLWTDRSKAVAVAKFEYRVEKIHYYFEKYHANLTMVWKTMFPLDPAPESLSALLTRFKNPAKIQSLVPKELLAGAELALASVLACHPTLDLEFIANVNRKLNQYYPVARCKYKWKMCPEYTICYMSYALWMFCPVQPRVMHNASLTAI
jgi:hypothetical protein